MKIDSNLIVHMLNHEDLCYLVKALVQKYYISSC
ncbi:protein of unknown function [Aminobacter niigataensis]|nr:protein of unknown function [Aminobacter niigataensis]